MIQIFNAISLEISFALNYANTFRNFICEIHVILSSIIITPSYLISLVTVNMEPPITKFEECLVNLILAL